jgi:hypothetical protein
MLRTYVRMYAYSGVEDFVMVIQKSAQIGEKDDHKNVYDYVCRYIWKSHNPNIQWNLTRNLNKLNLTLPFWQTTNKCCSLKRGQNVAQK